MAKDGEGWLNSVRPSLSSFALRALLSSLDVLRISLSFYVPAAAGFFEFGLANAVSLTIIFSVLLSLLSVPFFLPPLFVFTFSSTRLTVYMGSHTLTKSIIQFTCPFVTLQLCLPFFLTPFSFISFPSFLAEIFSNIANNKVAPSNIHNTSIDPRFDVSHKFTVSLSFDDINITKIFTSSRIGLDRRTTLKLRSRLRSRLQQSLLDGRLHV
ncbi:hypothetical protein SCHPADRAFT_658926 [Schizopora paradoxa]|uniref:Uncharacterized protein n=1 Tax=Schizopora paradoxa TaxID=27342 RepID=A0A0H2R5S4_9AGAM|nr:hypothetical protein SCHPADRAFT_658926 [Schizopora paradoxa]